jgi:hypothetical protein
MPPSLSRPLPTGFLAPSGTVSCSTSLGWLWKASPQIKSAARVSSLIFLLNILIAYSLAQICIWRNANTIGRGASVGVLLWIGFVAPITFTTYMYEMRPRTLFAINQFYPLAGMVLMGAIIGAWTKKSV